MSRAERSRPGSRTLSENVRLESRTRVGVVAADPLRSLGLVAILEDSARVEAVPLELEAAFRAEGLAALLLDSRSSVEALTETIGRLRRERAGVKLIVMGAGLDPEHVQTVIGCGAKGYLAQTADESEICMAIEVVLDGSIWAPRKVLARLIDAGGVTPGPGQTPGAVGDSIAGTMTRRELEVLDLLMDGRTNRDIAAVMGIDEVTVKAHLGRMLRKTRSSNRVELTLRAIEERTPGAKS